MKDLTILGNSIYDWSKKQPDLDVLTFVSFDSDGRMQEEVRTYKQLWQNGQKIAKALQAKGLKKGDSFAVVMANHPEFVDIMVASSILGTIFVPIDPRTKGDKLLYMLDFAECRGAFVADYAYNNVKQVWENGDNWIIPLSVGDNNLAQVLSAASTEPDLEVQSTDASEPMQMLYTSGTTGDPKAIMSPHSRFSVGVNVASIIGISKDDRPYTGLSLTHANAQLVTLGCILGLGLRGVISRKFTKSKLWDITRHYGCTWFNLLGGMTTAIYAEPRRSDDSENPVRVVLSAGMPGAIWSEFESRFGVKVTEFYGAAEGGLCFNVAGEGPIGSCGKPPPTLEMKIYSEGDVECAPGEAGEVCYRNADGSSPVVEYFKKPDASQEKTRGGWLRMGDIGHVDHDGWLYFHYRKGGGIRRNGDFINPAFVEKALSEVDCIDDVFVYGVPIQNGAPGEKDVVAAVVKKSGVKFDPDLIFAHCRQQLESNFVPGYLHVVDEIPKTASEKPQERFLLNAFDRNADFVIADVV